MIPMNNCSQAPQTDLTRAAAESYLDSWNRDGMNWDAWLAEVEGARAEFAKVVAAEPKEIAVFSSVSAATSTLASSLDFTGKRCKVVVSEAEFPTVGHVWLAHRKYGAEVVWVPVRDGVVHLEDYERVIDEETLLVSACHAYYQNGFKQDLAAIAKLAHDAGAWLYADAYQTTGVHVVDVRSLGVDFLAAGALKFLMGIPGIAFLYVRNELIERLEPALTGWFGRAEPFGFRVDRLDWADDAHRFDSGTPAVVNAYVARAGMRIINEIGPAAIQDWTDRLSQRLIESGAERGLEVHGVRDVRRKTPSTAFLVLGDSAVVEARLRDRGILASARGPAIRLAPHFYNTTEDVDTALDALAQVIREL